MNQIDYSSFYKFICSIGLILIISPFLLIYYFLNLDKLLLINSEQMSSLTETAKKAINFRQTILYSNISVIIFIAFLTIMIFAGIIMLYIGASSWYKRQKVLDRVEDISLEKMTQTEKEVKIIEEVNEVVKESSEINNEDKATGQVQVPLRQRITEIDELQNKGATIRSETMRLYLEIENEAISIVENQFKNTHFIKPNMKLDSATIDIVAESFNADINNYLFEIKYARKGNAWNTSMFNFLPVRLMETLNKYKKLFKSNSIMVLIIVLDDDNAVATMNNRLQRHSDLFSNSELKVVLCTIDSMKDDINLNRITSA